MVEQAASWGLTVIQYDFSGLEILRLAKPFGISVQAELKLFPYFSQVGAGADTG